MEEKQNVSDFAERKKAQREELSALLQSATEQVFQSEEKLKAYLDVQANLPRMGSGNVLLICVQRPDASELASFEQWAKQGGSVNKGEKSIAIFSAREGKDRNGKATTYFDVRRVFDRAQVSGLGSRSAASKSDRVEAAILKLSPDARETNPAAALILLLEDEAGKSENDRSVAKALASCAAYVTAKRYALPQKFDLREAVSLLAQATAMHSSESKEQHKMIRSMLDDVNKLAGRACSRIFDELQKTKPVKALDDAARDAR